MSILFDILAEVTKAGIEAAFKNAVGGSRMQPLDQFRSSRFGEPCDAIVDRPSLQDRHGAPVYQKNLQRPIERNREFEEARK
jgi:hypothetical protein